MQILKSLEKQRTIKFTKLFVAGNLKGFTFEDKITCPQSSVKRYLADMDVAVKIEHVHRSMGSAYIILNFSEV